MTMESNTKSVTKSVAEKWLTSNGVEYMVEREGPMCFRASGLYEHDSALGYCQFHTAAHGLNSMDAMDELVFEIINSDDFVGIPPIANFQTDGLRTLAAKLFDSTLHVVQAADELGMDVFHRWVDMREVEVALAQIGIRQCCCCGTWTSTKAIVENDGLCGGCHGEING